MIDAATIAEAFRRSPSRTVPDRVAFRTPGRRGHADLGASCASAPTRSPAAWPRSASARRHGGDHARQPARVPPRRPGRDDLGATPFSIYQTSRRSRSSTCVGDAGAKVAIVEQAFLDRSSQARGAPGLEHVIVVDGDAPDGTIAWPRSRARTRLRRRGGLARGRGRRPPHADLHVGHHRPAEGRPAHAPQPDDAIAGDRGLIQFPDESRSSRGCPPRTSPSATRTTTCRSSSG